MAAEIKVGATGWRHADWFDSFYPDDLPTDWQLSYYANEFPVVQLSPDDWLPADVATFRQWCDDVSNGFSFIIDITGCMDRPDALARLQQCVNALGDKVGGIVSWVPLSDPVAEQVETAAGDGLLVSLSNVPAVSDSRVAIASNRHACCLLVPTEVARDLPVLRQMMEAVSSASAEQSEIYLIFSGASPAIKVMKDAEVLQQLLNGVVG